MKSHQSKAIIIKRVRNFYKTVCTVLSKYLEPRVEKEMYLFLGVDAQFRVNMQSSHHKHSLRTARRNNQRMLTERLRNRQYTSPFTYSSLVSIATLPAMYFFC